MAFGFIVYSFTWAEFHLSLVGPIMSMFSPMSSAVHVGLSSLHIQLFLVSVITWKFSID